MGSSEMEQGMIDCGVGSIVWVRRRNGSWWPGKILRADELSASNVMSPRSGTPVKLLGREDASVDWYNLEKSKRVKAFRCGEFDDCIERAEASLGMPPKKREKYARREDAILHALELERELVRKKNWNINCSSNNKIRASSDNIVTREAVTSSKQSESQNGEQFNLKSHQTSETYGLTLKGENRVDILGEDIAQKGNHLSRDDDSSVLPRMRGLQDFGLTSALSEDKLLVSSNGDSKAVPDSNFLLDGTPKAEGLVTADRENLLAEGTFVKRQDKRRPLVQVLQTAEEFPVSYLQPDGSSAFMSVLGYDQPGLGHVKKARYAYLGAESGEDFCVKINLPPQTEISTPKLEKNTGPQPADSYEENTPGSTEYTKTDTTECESQESDGNDMATLSEGAASIELQPEYFGRSEAPAEHGSRNSEELDGFSGADSRPFCNDTVSACVGISKWQLKGKRNNRNIAKRSLNTFEANHLRTASYMSRPSDKGSCGGSEAASFITSRVVGSARRRNISKGDLSKIQRPISKGEYFDPPCNYHPPGGQTMLVDVNLKVQGSYHRQRVPMISLMSKINGQAIVGHPIQVEALENGAIDVFQETLKNDSSPLQPVWRTARRTASVRVPRPNISSGLDGGGSIQQPLSTDGSGQKPSTTRKNIPLPPVVKTFSRKAPKRISLSSNQKIRTLSSISSQQNQTSDLKHSSSNIFQVDGLMKQVTVPTVIACIPVKLVFSRLNEEFVGRPK